MCFCVGHANVMLTWQVYPNKDHLYLTSPLSTLSLKQKLLDASYVDCRARPRNDGPFPFTKQLLRPLSTARAIPMHAILTLAQLPEFGVNWLIPDAASTLVGGPHFNADQAPCGDHVRCLLYVFFMESQNLEVLLTRINASGWGVKEHSCRPVSFPSFYILMNHTCRSRRTSDALTRDGHGNPFWSTCLSALSFQWSSLSVRFHAKFVKGKSVSSLQSTYKSRCFSVWGRNSCFCSKKSIGIRIFLK